MIQIPIAISQDLVSLEKTMLSKADSRNKIGEDTSTGKLLHDIEAISKALYLDKAHQKSLPPTTNNRSKSTGKNHLSEPKSKLKGGNEDSLPKDKKSIWSWKALKALTPSRNSRFNCCFSLHVHSIDGLPPNFDDLSLCVHWKTRDGGLVTHPAKVFQGLAEFEEELTHSCSVSGSRSGPHHSAKYEAKQFLLYAAVYGSELDLGKHRVDLTRLLPLTLEELEEEKSSGRWTTSFKLSGKARGATLNVSFGYLVIGNDSLPPTAIRNAEAAKGLKQNRATSVNHEVKFDRSGSWSVIQRAGSLPARSLTSSHSVEHIKDLHEVLPTSTSELFDSVSTLYQKFDEEKVAISDDCKPELDVSSKPIDPVKPTSKENAENECEDGEFSVTVQGIELPSNELAKSEESDLKAADSSAVESPDISAANIDVGAVPKDDSKLHTHEEGFEDGGDKLMVSNDISDGNDLCTTDSLMKDLESALNTVSDLVMDGMDSQDDESVISTPQNNTDIRSNYRARRNAKSLNLDAATESVACEFLDMLGIDHSPMGLSSESEPESPRERLLRQFEKETLACGNPLFKFDMEEFGYEAASADWGTFSEALNLSSVVEPAEENLTLDNHVARSKTKASVLEDLETEALMREYGFSEKAFQYSPRNSPGGFGSPIDLPPEEPLQLPPLGEGLGPFVQTKNGGFLRSMNPGIFRSSKNGGSLIMQVSSPVVVPAEMGSGIMDILQRLASVGIEKLSMQANKLMPLEDITGKTVQQIAWEAGSLLEAPGTEGLLLQDEYDGGQSTSYGQKTVKGKSSVSKPNKFNSDSFGRGMDSECVSIEELAPLAMDKIEALSIEGLKIQSGMAVEDAPSNISGQPVHELPEGKRLNIGGSLGLDGAGGLQLLDIKDGGNDVDGLMGLSLTLDEWMRLDAGEIDEEEQFSERTSQILAAHHATSMDMIRGRSKGERKRGKGSNKKCGLFGNNFTVALMVQLRDPLRNYEPVGTPMLALIQVERVFVPPKPKIYSTVSELRNTCEEDEESETPKQESKAPVVEEDEKGIPKFKITEVHVAGLKSEPGKKKLWGSSGQQQSGSRWLLANGMGKSNKHPFMKSKVAATAAKSSSKQPAAASATTTVLPGDTLWSISSRVHGNGSKWKELAALNPHIRNPNVIFPNETIRLK